MCYVGCGVSEKENNTKCTVGLGWHNIEMSVAGGFKWQGEECAVLFSLGQMKTKMSLILEQSVHFKNTQMYLP